MSCLHVYFVYEDDNEWKQKFAEEKKRTKMLEKSIRKLKMDIQAVDETGKVKRQLVESELID